MKNTWPSAGVKLVTLVAPGRVKSIVGGAIALDELESFQKVPRIAPTGPWYPLMPPSPCIETMFPLSPSVEQKRQSQVELYCTPPVALNLNTSPPTIDKDMGNVSAHGPGGLFLVKM
jgi:hypothetical protein